MNRLIDLKPIMYVTGMLLIMFSFAMVVPAVADLASNSPDWKAFLSAAAFTFFVGGIFYEASRDQQMRLDRRQVYVLTVASWILITIFGALPLYFSVAKLSLTNAVFESMSGLTTTGSTVLTGIDLLPPGVLLWRSLLNWIGGFGIVVTALTVLPFLRVGGMQLFHSENSDISDKIFPQAGQIAGALAMVYCVLTIACAIALDMAGMTPFDAICHALATVSTGGLSTRDASIAYYNSASIEWITTAFMILGSLPIVYYVHVARDTRGGWGSDRQVPVFLGILLVSIILMTLWIWLTGLYDFADALRHAAFNVTAVITDTGYASADYTRWGPFAVGLVFILFFVGGCAGSTTGGIKIFRWMLLYRAFLNQLRYQTQPHRVLSLKFNNRPVMPAELTSVLMFISLYFVSFGLLTLALTLTGVDFLSASSGIASAMANAGPGLSPAIGPSGNFSGMPETAKWILIFAMLAGRLELLTLYTVLLPQTWRKF
ncbi:MAG: TrkH family potassium uptake protein [Parvibaculaceae bacterium]|nr:TrkH family potassium uptake protein [Parvibaculaceae bacterium]